MCAACNSMCSHFVDHCNALFTVAVIQMETLTPMTTAVILRHIAEALLYLHQQNLLHCHITSHAIHLVRLDVAKLGSLEYMIEE